MLNIIARLATILDNAVTVSDKVLRKNDSSTKITLIVLLVVRLEIMVTEFMLEYFIPSTIDCILFFLDIPISKQLTFFIEYP